MVRERNQECLSGVWLPYQVSGGWDSGFKLCLEGPWGCTPRGWAPGGFLEPPKGRRGGPRDQALPRENLYFSILFLVSLLVFFFLSSVNSIIHIFSQYLLMPTLFDLIFKSLRLEIILNYSD